MSLPETIWWCNVYENTTERPESCRSKPVMHVRCQELRVAGPDDQLATKQIEKLAQFIMDEVPGEPSQSEGAVDTAIRLLRGLPGPDDLVIRREGAAARIARAFYDADDTYWEDWESQTEDVKAWYLNMGEAALAATEGEEE